MQPPRESVCATRTLVEFAAGVKTGEDNFHRRHFFFWMQTDRDAAAIVFNAHAAIFVQSDEDIFAMATERFIRGIVNDLLNDVQWILGTGVHTGSLPDRFESLQDADG